MQYYLLATAVSNSCVNSSQVKIYQTSYANKVEEASKGSKIYIMEDNDETN